MLTLIKCPFADCVEITTPYSSTLSTSSEENVCKFFFKRKASCNLSRWAVPQSGLGGGGVTAVLAWREYPCPGWWRVPCPGVPSPSQDWGTPLPERTWNQSIPCCQWVSCPSPPFLCSNPDQLRKEGPPPIGNQSLMRKGKGAGVYFLKRGWRFCGDFVSY